MRTSPKRRLSVTACVLAMLATAFSGVGVAVDADSADAEATCSTPVTRNVRGKDATLDQCYLREFTVGATDYVVRTYYTEQSTATNTNRCTTAENTAGRCEHGLGGTDDANGNNVNAVALATEAEAMVRFYRAKGLSWPASGTTDLEVLIAEDPRTGGVIYDNTFFADDESVSNADVLGKRMLAFHEGMHLVQDQYDNGGIGWNDWYGEGIARAIEDRVDTTMDASTGAFPFFTGELAGLMMTDANRTSSTESTNYRSFLWWTWLFDQYRAGGDAEPSLGWAAILDFYEELDTESDQVKATRDFVSSRGGNYLKDWLDYTVSLWTYRLNPADPRLTYADSEVRTSGPQLSGHTIITGGPTFNAVQQTPNVSARSSRYFEMNPASQCAFASFEFDGKGKTFGYTVAGDASGTLQGRWSATGTSYARTVRTAGLSRVAGILTGLDDSGPVDVGWGCVDPNLTITQPTTNAFETVGQPSAPRRFLVRLDVNGPGGEPVGGLSSDAFTVSLVNGATTMPATVVSSSNIQDDYWLLVQAPDAAAGALAGTFYDLRVQLGSATATQAQSVLYVERSTDSVIVLDRSSSMGGGSGKIDAARNAATLFVGELADVDQGGYVTFNDNATLNVGLGTVAPAQRSTLESSIAATTDSGGTSIGDGMEKAAAAHDANRDPQHTCSFVLLSDGQENTAKFWADVANDVRDNGCAHHMVAFGPEANEGLMQQIAGSNPGGSYDYAEVSGSVQVGPGSSGGGGASSAGAGSLGWENNLARIYDGKAATVAGRQRLATFAGAGTPECVSGGVLDFADQTAGATFPTGDGFVTGGVKVLVDSFDPSHPGGGGLARIEASNRAGGITPEVGLVAASLRPDLGELCWVRFRASTGGLGSLDVNGEVVVGDLREMDGKEIGGARIHVTPDPTKSKTLVVTITGKIAGFAVGGRQVWVDDLAYGRPGPGSRFVVDDTTSELVVSLAWQDPSSTHTVELIDPSGTVVPSAGFRRASGTGTNEVWTVAKPTPGTWEVRVSDLDQQFVVSATAVTDLELRLLLPAQGLDPLPAGSEAMIAAVFSGPNGPITGGSVIALVTDPHGGKRMLTLFDDGGHGDGDADDGTYAAAYHATGSGEAASRPTKRRGERDSIDRPNPGSYKVDAVGELKDHRREASGSFAMAPGADLDGDTMTDAWETRTGLDPAAADASDDPDGDGLRNRCEFVLGTDPRASDTDASGEADGSEALDFGPFCVLLTDPARPGDDRAATLAGIQVHAEAEGLVAHVDVSWSSALDGAGIAAVRVERRPVGGDGAALGPWVTVAGGLTATSFTDTTVADGTTYQYRIVPQVSTPSGIRTSRVLESEPVAASNDPYAPGGSVVIEDNADTTASTTVTLHLIADDTEGGDHTATPAPGAPSTPLDQLEMRLSSTADFSGVAWQPFQPVVSGWDLGPLAPGSTGVVHVEFRDPAGNISEAGLGSVDTIVYQP